MSTAGAVTTVSLGADGGSTGSLALMDVVVGVFVGAPAFILALDLAGGMYLVEDGVVGEHDDGETAEASCSVPK